MKRTPTIRKLAGNRWLGLVLVLAFALALVPANAMRVSATTAPTLALSSANPAHISATTTALDRLRASPASVASAPACPAANTSYPAVPPNAIQIDPSADLYSCLNTGGNPLNGAATADWVKDTNPNTDTPALNNDIATGVALAPSSSVPVQTGAAAVGHWNGDRIVDGIGSADQDIFLNGGKENDTTTWHVGPGSVGSSKYDITQAYLANNQTNLYFGMERAGNNGTTAFDFEFNQKAPVSTYVPTRTVGDILFTFEMQGSGGSGSATPHYFTWNGSAYVEQTLPSSLKSSINLSSTPGEPWGFVNSHGVWATGNIDNFMFAEASVDLTQAFPGFSGCTGAKFFVEVRTRSSAGATSDLKDTTKIFQFTFGGPTAAATLQANCSQQFTYDGTGSADSNGGSNISYNWSFTPSPNTVTLSSSIANDPNFSGPDASGAYHSTSASGTVNVTLPSGVNSATISVVNNVTQIGTTCGASSGTKTVTVYRQLGATATLTPECANKFLYSSTVTGGLAPYTYSWQFQKNSAADGTGTWSNVTGGTSTAANGEFDASSSGPGAYRALLTVTDTADTSTGGKGQCTASPTSNTINVYNAVEATISLSTGCDSNITYTSTGSGGLAPYTYAITIKKNGTTVDSFTTSDTLAKPGVSGTLDVNTFAGGGDGSYQAFVTITDSQSIVCTANAPSNSIDVRNALQVSAAKSSTVDTSKMSVTVNSTAGEANNNSIPAGDTVTYKWQRCDSSGNNCVAISGATSATLTYSSFETDQTSPATINVTINGSPYTGLEYDVYVNVVISRTLNGNTCTATSNLVPLKKVIAVDP